MPGTPGGARQSGRCGASIRLLITQPQPWPGRRNRPCRPLDRGKANDRVYVQFRGAERTLRSHRAATGRRGIAGFPAGNGPLRDRPGILSRCGALLGGSGRSGGGSGATSLGAVFFARPPARCRSGRPRAGMRPASVRRRQAVAGRATRRPPRADSHRVRPPWPRRSERHAASRSRSPESTPAPPRRTAAGTPPPSASVWETRQDHPAERQVPGGPNPPTTAPTNPRPAVPSGSRSGL
jgi:hypothetical protein